MQTVTEKPTPKAISEGYKRTEIGVIPDDWEVKEFGNITKPSNLRISANKTDRNIRCIELEHIQQSTGQVDGYSNLQDQKSTKTIFSKGDVLFGKLRPYLRKFHYAEFDGVCSTEIWVFLKGDGVDSKFLYYIVQLDSFIEASNKSTGTHMPRADWDVVKEHKVAFPPTLEEQRTIAEALSDVDALIAALDALIQKKQQVKKGAMQQLLTGKKQLPGFDGEWEEKKLGEVANVQRGASPRPISSPKWFSLKKDVGWVRISDISNSDGKNLLKTTDYLSKAGIERSRFLPKGSLILSIAATVGLPVITRIDTCIHDGFVGLTNLDIDQEFLYYKLKELEKDLVEMGQTGSQNNINSTIVRNVEALFPAEEEQKTIARILSDMDAEIQALQAKRAKYQKIKQGMMQELLTGKTRLV